MVDLAREHAPDAEIVLASAEPLPFPDGSFTAVAMSVVFFFFSDQAAVLCECHRVMAAGGRLAIYTTGPELRGTPAAPEPLASHSYFHSDEDLAALAHRAGFANPAVSNDRGGQLLTAVHDRLSPQADPSSTRTPTSIKCPAVAVSGTTSQSKVRMARAGTPATRVAAGMSRLTTAPAATTAPSPTATPPTTVAPAQIQTLAPM